MVGRITGLPVYTLDYAGVQILENQRDNSLKSGIHNIIKSPCSRYIIIQMSQSHLMHCYSLEPVFEPKFEVFAFKLFEYTPVNTPANNPAAGVAWFANQGLSVSSVSYQFTPAGNFIYCMHDTTLHKLDTLTGRELYKDQIGDTRFKQLIPLDDNMICGHYLKDYNREEDDIAQVWGLTTEHKLYFKLGRVSESGIEWLDTLEVLADDAWLLPATYGQLFGYETKIACILDRNILYFTHESRISWSVLALPIDILANKFGQGRIVYQHPATDRDTLCPDLKYVYMDKLYGVIMNDMNFQIICIALAGNEAMHLQGLEVLAAGHHFNLPYKEKWDHSEHIRELSFIDEPVVINKPDSLFTKIVNAIKNVVMTGSDIVDREDEDPSESDGAADGYMDIHNDVKQSKIIAIEFTPDMACVFVCYSDGVYVYKAKLTYREVDELVTNMDTRLADLGIDMPPEILTDIACTVAIPEARLAVSDTHKVSCIAEIEVKLAERMRALNNDNETKIEKQSNSDFMKPRSVRDEKLHIVGNLKYSTNPDVNYRTGSCVLDYNTLE